LNDICLLTDPLAYLRRRRMTTSPISPEPSSSSDGSGGDDAGEGDAGRGGKAGDVIVVPSFPAKN
jgi:hypothetical protein